MSKVESFCLVKKRDWQMSAGLRGSPNFRVVEESGWQNQVAGTRQDQINAFLMFFGLGFFPYIRCVEIDYEAPH